MGKTAAKEVDKIGSSRVSEIIFILRRCSSWPEFVSDSCGATLGRLLEVMESAKL